MPESTDRKTFPFEKLEKFILALIIVVAATLIMFLIGRDILGEGVIALLYLVPISWITARWGQGPGILSAVASALAFDFLFIPPFYTFNVGSLEGWLLLVIFLIVAIVVVGRVQVGLRQAQRREHEAILMYELSNDLADARGPEAIARALGSKLQEYYMAEQVQVVFQVGDVSVIANLPSQATAQSKPNLITPIMPAKELIGEIRIWEGRISLPSEDDRLLRNLTNQSALALERTKLVSSGGGFS